MERGEWLDSLEAPAGARGVEREHYENIDVEEAEKVLLRGAGHQLRL